jgi:hypothetical protein
MNKSEHKLIHRLLEVGLDEACKYSSKELQEACFSYLTYLKEINSLKSKEHKSWHVIHQTEGGIENCKTCARLRQWEVDLYCLDSYYEEI